MHVFLSHGCIFLPSSLKLMKTLKKSSGAPKLRRKREWFLCDEECFIVGLKYLS